MVKQIRKRCLDCSVTTNRVSDCEEDCSLHPYRFGKNPNFGKPGTVPYTASEAVYKYCLWCCGDSAQEVKLCTSKKCPLYDYRSRGVRYPRKTANVG